MSCIDPHDVVGVCPTLTPISYQDEANDIKQDNLTDGAAVATDQKKKRWSLPGFGKKVLEMAKNFRPKNKQKVEERQDQEGEVEEFSTASRSEQRSKKAVEASSAAMPSISKSFSMASVSKSFSKLSAQKSRSYDYDIETTASDQSEISGLVRFLSNTENVERGFEVLLEDYKGFSLLRGGAAPSIDNEAAVDADAAAVEEEKKEDPLEQLLGNASNMLSEHDEPREAVTESPESTQSETTGEDTKLDREADYDGDDEVSDYIPPQLSMRSHVSTVSRASQKSVLSRLSQRKPKDQLSVQDSGKFETSEIPAVNSNISAKSSSGKRDVTEIPAVNSNISKKSSKSIKSNRSTSRLPPLNLQRSSSTASQSSKALIKQTESNVSKKPASVPNNLSAPSQQEAQPTIPPSMSTSSQQELIEAKPSKSFVEAPDTTSGSAVSSVPDQEINEPVLSPVASE